ncbi:sugar transporter [Pyricularia oryzae Y34]|uniref:Sugar transporter n=1 Tax=Pyricularia oryzae (strain Y34) TaxID=1143189 RepID=A0AA97NWB9_PYRO3|nr:sugar transporter [Pyricularia oryzae Y34]
MTADKLPSPLRPASTPPSGTLQSPYGQEEQSARGQGGSEMDPNNNASTTPPKTNDQHRRQRLQAQARRRRINNRAIIDNPLAHVTDEDLTQDAQQFARAWLSDVPGSARKLLRAARVAKDIRTYDDVARGLGGDGGAELLLPVVLTEAEKRALRDERDATFSERGMRVVVLTVSLAAFLQGHVQSSVNAASTYAALLGLRVPWVPAAAGGGETVELDRWRLGAANAAPFLAAGLMGCLLALPVNKAVGRRGAMAVAALLILASSLAAAFVRRWDVLLAVRVFNGLGMGIKAVSTPILASEASVVRTDGGANTGFWRGTSILAWQLWVAFGIMMGFILNIVFHAACGDNQDLALSLILAGPVVPSLMMLAGLWYCPESPRYYMRPRSPNYSPSKAFTILKKLRNTELQALRDLYLMHKSIEQEEYLGLPKMSKQMRRGFFGRVVEYGMLIQQLFAERRLRNALISSCTVNLCQQLCGINILAFYSGDLFLRIGARSDMNDQSGYHKRMAAFGFSCGFGAINFIFALPAIRTIDTLGRRKWLIITLPLMALFMGAAAASFSIPDMRFRIGVVVMWLFFSPSHTGCAFAIATNLTFAGILSIFFLNIYSGLGDAGCLALFSGLNLLALVLVFLLVEETKRRSLEDLDLVFAVPKRVFIKYQVGTFLPWFMRRCLRRVVGRRGAGDDEAPPSLYIDRTWDRARRHGGRTVLQNAGLERQRTRQRWPGGGGVGVGMHMGQAMSGYSGYNQRQQGWEARRASLSGTDDDSLHA